MAAAPKFKHLAALSDALTAARGMARVPEGKGGYVFVDGQLHRILDIKEPISGHGAFGYSVNEKELAHLCDHLSVGALGFKGLRTTTIAPLQKLTGLRKLSLWWVQKLADLSPLATLPLQALELDDIRYAHDISPLAQMPTLRALVIAGGMNSTQQIDTLIPLTKLPELCELRMMSLRLGDDSLRALVACPALRDLHLPNTFATEDYAYLRAKRPELRCEALCAYQTSDRAVFADKNVMVTGRRKPFLNARKDAARLAKYQAQFDALLKKYQQSDD